MEKGEKVGDRRVVSMRLYEAKHEALARRGILILDGEIDESSAFNFCVNSLYFGLEGNYKKNSLLVILNTPGGSVEYGLAIYDSIRMLVACGVEVHVLGLGHVASMGTIILQAGSKRLSTPNTQFLIHQVSQSVGFFKSEETKELEERSVELKRLNNVVLGIIAERSGIPLEKLKGLCEKKNFWMDADTACSKFGANGLIDQIVESPETITKAFGA